MARPEKQNADYFSHDNNMRNDPAVKYIRTMYGLPGYAIYNMLLEYLCYSDGLKIERNDHQIKLMSGDFGVARDALIEHVEQMIDIELIILADGYIYSKGLNNRLQVVFDKRNAAKARFLGQKVHKVKESKVKESKEDIETPIKTPPKKPESIKNILSEEKLIEARGLDILQEFVIYWSEPDKNGTEKRMKQKTWDLTGRLTTRKKNKQTNFGRKPVVDYEDIHNFNRAINAGQVEDIKDFFRSKYGTGVSTPGRQIWQDKYAETKDKWKKSPLFTTP